jgi:hypothetical protein
MGMDTTLLVRIPRRYATGEVTWARLVRGLPHPQNFRMSPREHAFAKDVLRVRPQWWLWRVCQRAFSGDFALVDMSPRDPRQRTPWLVDLKLGAPLRLGGGGAGNQLVRAPAVVAQLDALGVVEGGAVTLLTGGHGPLLDHIRGGG